MEGFMTTLFKEGADLRRAFSFLLVPMLNPDGVVCGRLRTTLFGDDQNRVWRETGARRVPEVEAMQRAIAGLTRDRELLFAVDFHGHTNAVNALTYGAGNFRMLEINGADRLFPMVMHRHCSFMNRGSCWEGDDPTYQGTMRAVMRSRFRVLFAYTIEMRSVVQRSGGLRGGTSALPTIGRWGLQRWPRCGSVLLELRLVM
jgi:hypothetical protein